MTPVPPAPLNPPDPPPEQSLTPARHDTNGDTQILDSPAFGLGDVRPRRLTTPSRWAWVIDRNPFFLISGVSMFAGCFAVSQAIHADPDAPEALWMLVGLIVAMNLYEVTAIALGLLLFRTRALVRDSRHLLGLSLLLMADVAFVYNESATANIWVGAALASVATVLAIAKAQFISRFLGVRLTWMASGVVALDFAVLFFMPLIHRLIGGDGFIAPAAMFLVWTGLGALVAVHALPKVWAHVAGAEHADRRQLQQLIRGGVIALPLISAIAHAAVALWVYGTRFEIAMIAPMLLGIAVVVLVAGARLGRAHAAASASIFAASAVVATLRTSDRLMTTSWPEAVTLSPMRGVLLGCVCLFAWVAWQERWRVLPISAAVFSLALAGLGYSPASMLHRLRWLGDLLAEVIRALLPDTLMKWGITGVALAFAFLGLGAVVSLWRQHINNTHEAA